MVFSPSYLHNFLFSDVIQGGAHKKERQSQQKVERHRVNILIWTGIGRLAIVVSVTNLSVVNLEQNLFLFLVQAAIILIASIIGLFLLYLIVKSKSYSL